MGRWRSALEALQFVEDDVRGAHRAPRGVDLQDHRLDVVVLGGLLQFLFHPAGGGDSLEEAQKAVGATLQDHAVDVHQQDLVPAVARDGLLLQGFGLFEEADLDGDATGQQQEQEAGQDQIVHDFGTHKPPFWTVFLAEAAREPPLQDRSFISL